MNTSAMLNEPGILSDKGAPARAPDSAVAVPIAVAAGDGIGPEIMDATLRVLDEAGARILSRPITLGLERYRQGMTSGIGESEWEALDETCILLKGPITTPQGAGMKSLNVTLRKTLGLFANIRPSVSYHPSIRSVHPAIDLVIVRENEEDVYAGIEHRQSQDVVQCLKLVSIPGTEAVVRYAFEYAARNGRSRVTCFTKDNIMKMTDGLFHEIFDRIAAEYPGIESEHLIVDIGIARVASNPSAFDVIVLPNLYGDILSDVAAEISGSVGLAPSANIGRRHAMFEAVHGSADSLAGLQVANPSGLLLSAVMMLAHIGQADVAERIHNAWLATIEDGLHPADIYTPASSRQMVGTDEFASAVIGRFGTEPRTFRPVRYGDVVPVGDLAASPRTSLRQELVGIDIFLQWPGDRPDLLADTVRASADGLPLQLITNRGIKVWPDGNAATFCTDHWRCRFEGDGRKVDYREILGLISSLVESGHQVIKTENLYTFDGTPGYSRAHGQ